MAWFLGYFRFDTCHRSQKSMAGTRSPSYYLLLFSSSRPTFCVVKTAFQEILKTKIPGSGGFVSGIKDRPSRSAHLNAERYVTFAIRTAKKSIGQTKRSRASSAPWLYLCMGGPRCVSLGSSCLCVKYVSIYTYIYIYITRLGSETVVQQACTGGSYYRYLGPERHIRVVSFR